MSFLLRNMLESQGFWSPAGDDGAAAGGGGGGSNQNNDDKGGDDNQGGEGGSDDGDKGGDDDADGDKSGGGDDNSSKDKGGDKTLLQELMGWKEKAKKSGKAADDANAALQAVQDVMGDLSIDEVKGLVDAKKESEKKALEDKGEYESIVSQMKEAHEGETKSLNDKIAELTEQLGVANKSIEDMTVGRQFSDSGFISKSSILPPRIARQQFGSHFELEDGEIVGYDKPRGQSNRTRLVGSSGDNLGFEDAIAKLYQSHPDAKDLLRSKAKPGSDSNTTQDNSTEKKSDSSDSPKGLNRIRAGLEASD